MAWECHAWYECHWSHGWTVALVANSVIFLVYMAIAYKIFLNLREAKTWGENPLALATGSLFLTCGIGHGILATHLVVPVWGIEEASGLALRQAFNEWHMWLWPPLTASAGIFYWTLRNRFSALVRGAGLFEDLQQRRSQAMEIHDNVVQGIATAKMALEQGDEEAARDSLDQALEQSQYIISDLMGPHEDGLEVSPGDLRRERAAGDVQ